MDKAIDIQCSVEVASMMSSQYSANSAYICTPVKTAIHESGWKEAVDNMVVKALTVDGSTQAKKEVGDAGA